MKRLVQGNVCCFALTETEWYAGTEQQREAWQVQCEREAQEYRCQYANILVQPDAIMSISPIEGPHIVWRATFGTSAWKHIEGLFADHKVSCPPALRDTLALYFDAYRGKS